MAANPKVKEAEAVETAVVHEDNEYGICLESEDAGEEQSSQSVGTAGVSLAYAPKAKQEEEEVVEAEEEEESLEELMARNARL